MLMNTEKGAQHYLGEIANRVRENPDMWTRGSLARDPSGRPVKLEDPTAIRFCGRGLILAFVPERLQAEASTLVTTALERWFGYHRQYRNVGLEEWNDCHARSVTEVIDLFEQAARAEPAPPVRLPGWMRLDPNVFRQIPTLNPAQMLEEIQRIHRQSFTAVITWSEFA